MFFVKIYLVTIRGEVSGDFMKSTRGAPLRYDVDRLCGFAVIQSDALEIWRSNYAGGR